MEQDLKVRVPRPIKGVEPKVGAPGPIKWNRTKGTSTRTNQMEQDLRYEHQDQPNGTGPKGRRTRTNQMEQDLKVGVAGPIKWNRT